MKQMMTWNVGMMSYKKRRSMLGSSFGRWHSAPMFHTRSVTRLVLTGRPIMQQTSCLLLGCSPAALKYGTLGLVSKNCFPKLVSSLNYKRFIIRSLYKNLY